MPVVDGALLRPWRSNRRATALKRTNAGFGGGVDRQGLKGDGQAEFGGDRQARVCRGSDRRYFDGANRLYVWTGYRQKGFGGAWTGRV